jgi:hypothetical protein
MTARVIVDGVKSLSQLRRRLPLVAVVVLAVVGVTAIGFSSKGESAPESMPGLDPFHSQTRSPCDEPVIVLAPESFVVTRDMVDALRQRVEVADLPRYADRDLLLDVPVLIERPEPSLRTRLRRAVRSLRDRVAVEDRQDAVPPAGYAFDAEECRQ